MAWFRNLKIGSKLLLSFLFILVIAAGTGIFTVVNMKQIDTTYSDALDLTQQRFTLIVSMKDHYARVRMVVREVFYPENTRAELVSLHKEMDTELSALQTEIAELAKIATGAVAAKVNGVSSMADRYRTDMQSGIEVLLAIGEISIDNPEYAHALIAFQEKVNAAGIAYANQMSQDMTDSSAMALKALSDLAESSGAKADTALLLTVVLLIVMAALVLAVTFTVSASIRKPLTRLIDIADNVAKGNLNVNIDSASRDETGMLAKSFASVVGVVNSLTTDVKGLYRVFNVEGDIEAKLETARFSGAYQEMAESINAVVGSIVNDAMLELRLLQEFGEGDFTLEVPDMPGKRMIIKDSVEKFKKIIHGLNDEINTLVQDVLEGKLRERADETAFTGDWAQLMKGLNNLMEAIAAPVNEVSAVMDQVSAGNFNVKMKGNYKGDFYSLQQAINTTVTNIASYIEEISRVLSNLSNNDLNQAITREYTGSFSAIKDAMNNIIETLNHVIGDIGSSAEQVAAGARSISESSMTLASGASEQASSVEELNATVLTINESTVRNSDNAKTAERISEDSKNNAALGEADMKHMLTAMNGIKDSSSDISKVIKVIDEIAFQTNLLALNASVEAARAGEHGRGFAVVADEVRSLASRSQESARETAAMIEESNRKVDEGMALADKTANALQTIIGDVNRIAGIISNIAIASQEQAEAIGQVTEGLNQITEVVQNNSATSEEAASAAEELSSQSEVMRTLVSVFSLKK